MVECVYVCVQIEILRKLDHPHIVGLKEVVVAKQNTYIMMELLSGGEVRHENPSQPPGASFSDTGRLFFRHRPSDDTYAPPARAFMLGCTRWRCHRPLGAAPTVVWLLYC